MPPRRVNMATVNSILVLFLSLFIKNVFSSILCESGFCEEYTSEEGCATPAQHCSINNATHTGIWLPSPTLCNCCHFCLPFYGENEPCSVGGPGLGHTVGRCGPGLTCVIDTDGHSYCRRMESACHSAQDDYDKRYASGEIGALEFRPVCDGKAKFATYDCVPAHTCFCQSEDGERLFGEVLYQGVTTTQNMHCGCSRLHEKIKHSIAPGVPYPVIGPRCTADGNFHPVQCINRVCYCVNRVTGEIQSDEEVELDEEPITKLSCYDPTLDLFPDQTQGVPPYNFTTPCLEHMRRKIQLLHQSEQDGYIVDYFSSVDECLPDGTYGRVAKTTNGTQICVDANNQKIGDYEALPNTPEYSSMNCKCAQTHLLMSTSTEKPVCCKNGNYRPVQCRRGLCRCVDGDGRQLGRDHSDVTLLPCYSPEWRNC